MQFSGGEHDFYGPYAAARGKPMSITETAALWNPAPDTRASAPTELQVKSLWCACRAALRAPLCTSGLLLLLHGKAHVACVEGTARMVCFQCGLCCGARAGGSKSTTPPATPPTR